MDCEFGEKCFAKLLAEVFELVHRHILDIVRTLYFIEVYHTLLQIFVIEIDYFVKGNNIDLIVEVGVGSTGYNKQFFIVAGQFGEGVLRRGKRICLVAMDDEHGGAYFIGMVKQGVSQKG